MIPVALPVITHIISKSISSNTFSVSWKIAKGKPIPKGAKVEEYKDQKTNQYFANPLRNARNTVRC